MKDLVLYCKSYSADLLRCVNLVRSVQRFNVEGISLYLSVPSVDQEIFAKHLKPFDLTLVCDEAIIKATPGVDPAHLAKLPGSVSQQIVKSSFWRLGYSTNYVCLDSDNEFIREFRQSDFICEDGIPYTVIGEGKDHLTYFASKGITKVQTYLDKEAADAQAFFGRAGKAYDFGIPPLVWSRKVWESLDAFLVQKNITFTDALIQYPYELRLYGEALLKFQAVPLRPAEPFFRAYLHEIQYQSDRKRGITIDVLKQNYLGVVRQSNWDGTGYGEHKSGLSLINRKLKTLFRILRG
jgi:Family of unknown function (DUF6492)